MQGKEELVDLNKEELVVSNIENSDYFFKNLPHVPYLQIISYLNAADLTNLGRRLSKEALLPKSPFYKIMTMVDQYFPTYNSKMTQILLKKIISESKGYNIVEDHEEILSTWEKHFEVAFSLIYDHFTRPSLLERGKFITIKDKLMGKMKSLNNDKYLEQIEISLEKEISLVFEKYGLQFDSFLESKNDSIVNWNENKTIISKLVSKTKKSGFYKELSLLENKSRVIIPTISNYNNEHTFIYYRDILLEICLDIFKQYELESMFEEFKARYPVDKWPNHTKLLSDILKQEKKELAKDFQALDELITKFKNYDILFNLFKKLTETDYFIDFADYYYNLLNVLNCFNSILLALENLDLYLPVESYFTLFSRKCDYLPEKNKDAFKIACQLINMDGLTPIDCYKRHSGSKELMAFFGKKLNGGTNKLNNGYLIINQRRAFRVIHGLVLNENHPPATVKKYHHTLLLKNLYGETPLHLAVTNKDLGWINYIIDTLKYHNILQHIDEVDTHGNTPLMAACLAGNVDAIQILLEHGAKMSATNASGNSFFSLLAHPRFESMSKRDPYKITPLHLVTQFLTVNELKILPQKCLYEINSQNIQGVTPLHLAVINGCLEKIKWLIDRGANLNLKDKFGMTPIDYFYLFPEKYEEFLKVYPESTVTMRTISLDLLVTLEKEFPYLVKQSIKYHPELGLPDLLIASRDKRTDYLTQFAAIISQKVSPEGDFKFQNQFIKAFLKLLDYIVQLQSSSEKKSLNKKSFYYQNELIAASLLVQVLIGSSNPEHLEPHHRFLKAHKRCSFFLKLPFLNEMLLSNNNKT
ncbi:MAG: ankyrin repeat domain-containing protein [Legionella sp.]|nr:ankyrin repeat domain-containing protein [Legionella sp.]